MIDDGKFCTLTEIAAPEGMDRGQASRIAQLARLAPAIVEACVNEPAKGLALETVLRRGVVAPKLRAAWVCDDGRKDAAAVACRNAAALEFARVRPFADSDKGVTVALVLVDVLRRAGRFDEALAEIEALHGFSAVQGALVDILDLQSRLCAKRDAAVHCVSECRC